MSIVRLSKEETEYVRQGFEAGVRADGRGVFDFREIDIITDVVSQATGSARVRLGSTEVLVGVKVREVGQRSGNTFGHPKIQPGINVT